MREANDVVLRLDLGVRRVWQPQIEVLFDIHHSFICVLRHDMHVCVCVCACVCVCVLCAHACLAFCMYEYYPH